MECANVDSVKPNMVPKEESTTQAEAMFGRTKSTVAPNEEGMTLTHHRCSVYWSGFCQHAIAEVSINPTCPHQPPPGHSAEPGDTPLHVDERHVGRGPSPGEKCLPVE